MDTRFTPKHQARQIERHFDAVSFIMAFESEDMDEADVVEGFQHLIDEGTVWHLQGSYGRMAAHLIDAGLCHPAAAPRVRRFRRDEVPS